MTLEYVHYIVNNITAVNSISNVLGHSAPVENDALIGQFCTKVWLNVIKS